ncbi:MAG: threonine synthase, partial [Spirochaetaceae bacterium]|nr:threonine synthase [Spirochaetaceae bacterium]
LADDDSATVLISRNHPAFYSDSVKRMCGRAAELPENLEKLFVPNKVEKTISPDRTAIINILHEIK